MNVLMCVSVVILSSGEPVLRAVTYRSKTNLEHVTNRRLNELNISSKPLFGLMEGGHALKFALKRSLPLLRRFIWEPPSRASVYIADSRIDTVIYI